MVNRDPAVEKWFETYDNPQKALVHGVRQVILIASFDPRSTTHVSLMFHTGAVLPDPTGLLEGSLDLC